MIHEKSVTISISVIFKWYKYLIYYNIEEIKIIKDVNSEEETNEEEAEYKQELNELETLEEQDKKINS